MNKKRLTNISSLLADYSLGNFNKKLTLSDNLDEIDSIISGINMLGEELEETTISKKFFENIYNSVTDMLFVIDDNGKIINVNSVVETNFLNIKKTEFTQLCAIENVNNSFEFLKKKKNNFRFEAEFSHHESQKYFVSCSFVNIKTTRNGDLGDYLVIAEDVTDKKEIERRILRTVIETQENERKRVANDLHDSLGQELSFLKMMLEVIKNNTDETKHKNILISCTDSLEGSIKNLRSICFDLMPSVLDNGDLILAIKELIKNSVIDIDLKTNVDFLNLSKEQEVSIYRIIQEFVNNTIKHAKASYIKINFQLIDKTLNILIIDNGIGFDFNLDHTKRGRGLNTIHTRIESFNGKAKLSSSIGKGTKLKMTFNVK